MSVEWNFISKITPKHIYEAEPHNVPQIIDFRPPKHGEFYIEKTNNVLGLGSIIRMACDDFPNSEPRFVVKCEKELNVAAWMK